MISPVNTQIQNNTDEHLHYRFTRVEIPLGAKGEDNDYYVMNGDVFTKLMDEEAAQLIADHRLGNITLTYDVDAVVPTINDHGVIPEYRRLNPVLQARGDLPVEGGSVKHEFRLLNLMFSKLQTLVMTKNYCEKCERTSYCPRKEAVQAQIKAKETPECERCWSVSISTASGFGIAGVKAYINGVGPYFSNSTGRLNVYVEDDPNGWDVSISSDGCVDTVEHLDYKPKPQQVAYQIGVPPARPPQQFLVLGEGGKPIEGATVYVEEFGTQVTDENGVTVFKRLPYMAKPHKKEEAEEAAAEEAPAEEAPAEEAPAEEAPAAEEPAAEEPAAAEELEQVTAIDTVSSDSGTPEYNLSYYVLKKGYAPFEGTIPAEPKPKKAKQQVWVVKLTKLEEFSMKK